MDELVTLSELLKPDNTTLEVLQFIVNNEMTILQVRDTHYTSRSYSTSYYFNKASCIGRIGRTKLFLN